jgi:hypothetical protein
MGACRVQGVTHATHAWGMGHGAWGRWLAWAAAQFHSRMMPVGRSVTRGVDFRNPRLNPRLTHATHAERRPRRGRRGLRPPLGGAYPRLTHAGAFRPARQPTPRRTAPRPDHPAPGTRSLPRARGDGAHGRHARALVLRGPPRTSGHPARPVTPATRRAGLPGPPRTYGTRHPGHRAHRHPHPPAARHARRLGVVRQQQHEARAISRTMTCGGDPRAHRRGTTGGHIRASSRAAKPTGGLSLHQAALFRGHDFGRSAQPHPATSRRSKF